MENTVKIDSGASKKASICFVSLNSYPVLTGRDLGYVGGAEVQQVILARELKKYGFDISFITYDHRETDSSLESVGGIRILRTYYRDTSFFLSLVYKIWHIWKAMRRADADLYFFESGSSGIVSVLSKLMGKKYIRYIASDSNVSSEKYKVGIIERMGSWIDFKLADRIISQNHFQKEALRKGFHRESTIIKPAFPVTGLKKPNKADPIIVLWVGRIDAVKRPQLFLDLADSIPEARFQMIGGFAQDRILYSGISKAASEISNLEFLGHIPFDKVEVYFQKASILINTSQYEGFPNTYIQAWQQYVPTIALVADPDAVINNNRLGFRSGSIGNMVRDVKRLLEDNDLRLQMGENAWQYFKNNHDIRNVVKEYVEVFGHCGLET